MATGKNRYYTRFVPREEVGEVTRWQFGAVDGALGVLEPLIAQPAAVLHAAEDVLPEVVALNEHEALLLQAREEAHAQGLAEGRDAERLAWQQRMDEHVAGPGREAAARMAQLAQSFEASLSGLQQDMAQNLLGLACDIARQVLRSELAVNRRAVLPVVREALSMLGNESRPASVRLNPADWQEVHEALRAEHPSTRIEWLQDAAVQPGECLVESSGMVIDGTLEQRWRRAIAALGLTEAWRSGEGSHDD
ncbi:flagellar assembly protein FliH [Melaminivora suipulveris]|uniref:Flagellar assembly protein FliH n=1 Tax=Melaminivora suipulveris TaxID=2109913 RepID=A0A2R3QD92_9BURK|nr:flagellar assembly protein FliH [Melaminivora suipulveris]AVO49746.1 flagellar assembly protein FliH [Melaminivora suipulveris]